MKSFVLIGCGNIAGRHAQNIVRFGKLAAVCDVVPERADAMAEQYGASVYYDADELLAAETGADTVVVCTPHGLHAEHIIKSLQAGKDVLTEKPLCLTKAAAWQIIETEKFCRRKVYVVQSLRYNPLLQQLEDLLRKNALGRIYSFELNANWHRPDGYYTDWRGSLFPDGGALYNQFCHCVDALLYLFGEVDEAKGFSTNAAHLESIEYEDTGTVALRMNNGTLGAFHWSLNASGKNHETALTVVAEKATLRLGGEYLNEVQYLQSAIPLSLAGTERLNLNFHRDMYDRLNKVGQTKADFPGAFDGLRTVETIEKIYNAVR